MKRRVRGLAVAVAAVAAGFLTAPSLAAGAHHLVQIREVYPGTVAAPAAEFVELQMYSGGQNDFAPASSLVFYGPDGLVDATDPLEDVPSGQSQRSALYGTAGAATAFGVALDGTFQNGTEVVVDVMDPAGGAVCFTSTTSGIIDCVRWGTMTSPPAGTGDPEAAIADGSSIERSIAPGCSTLLEAGDDTNDSATDFAPAAPSPRNNATTPTEAPCPDTTITKKPKKRTTDRTPTFKFVSVPAGSLFECKLDDGGFEACESPFKPGRLARGKHAFKVQAQGDPDPASYRWRIVKPQ